MVKYTDSRIDGKSENEVFFFLDEFANIGEIPDFNKKISTVRSRGIALVPIVQNIGQIKNRYPIDSWQEIIGNCDIRLCLGAADILTAQYFSDLLGVTTVETQSIRKEGGIEGNLEYGQKNISTLKRNLLNADEILRLPHNQLLVNIRGNKPVLLEKMIYTEHELAKKLQDVSINEYNPIWNKNDSKKSRIIFKNEIKKEEKNKENQEITFDNF